MNYFFIGLLLACTAYAMVAGGTPERVGAVAYASSVVATFLLLASHPDRWQTTEMGELIVDTLVFAAFAVLALRADRFWPIWASALLGLGLLGHLARLAETDMNRWVYAVTLSIWSYPILAIIALGTWAHGRRLVLDGAGKSS